MVYNRLSASGADFNNICYAPEVGVKPGSDSPSWQVLTAARHWLTEPHKTRHYRTIDLDNSIFEREPAVLGINGLRGRNGTILEPALPYPVTSAFQFYGGEREFAPPQNTPSRLFALVGLLRSRSLIEHWLNLLIS